MVLKPNVSPHKQIVKDDDVEECISTEEMKIESISFFSSKSCNIPLIQFIPHPKWCMHTFGPKPHLLTTKYHRGRAYIVYCIWPLLTYDLHEGHSPPKLASAALLTKFGSHRPGSHELRHSIYCSNSKSYYEIFSTTTLDYWKIIMIVLGSHMPNMNYEVYCGSASVELTQ